VLSHPIAACVFGYPPRNLTMKPTDIEMDAAIAEEASLKVKAARKRLSGTQPRQSRMTRDGRRLLEHFSFGKCEQLGGFYRANREFNGDGADVSYLRAKETTMKLTTIALAIAFTVPSTYALARGGHGGGMHIGSSVSRPFASSVGTGRIANRPRNITGNTFAPIAHDPSGSTLTGSAMNRTGG
jgi:hypothetical protein